MHPNIDANAWMTTSDLAVVDAQRTIKPKVKIVTIIISTLLRYTLPPHFYNLSSPKLFTNELSSPRRHLFSENGVYIGVEANTCTLRAASCQTRGSTITER